MVHLNRNKNVLSKTSKIYIKDSSKLKLFICGNTFSKQVEIENLLTTLGFQSKNIFHGPRDLGKFKKINNSSFDMAIIDLRKTIYSDLINLDRIANKTPTIVISDILNSDIDDHIVECGVYASLSSRELSEINLSRIIKHMIARKRYENTIFNKINVDELSNLFNLRAFNKKLDCFFKEAELYNLRFALIYLDINNFKLINDSYGHIAGDFIIQEISKRLKSCIRKEDICARVGGDEFACLIKDLQNYKNLDKIIQRINRSIELPIHYEKKIHFISVSVGKSIYPDQAKSTHHLLDLADREMYKMKNLGPKVIKAA